MSLPARAVFVLLVVATFAAFFVAQRLKSAPTVANLRSISQHFSPNDDGRRDVARIRLRIRRDDDVTVSIVDDLGTEVKRLATAVPASPEEPLRLSWDGTADDGAAAPQGYYRVRVSLRSGNRAVTLRPGINLDLTAPRPTVKVGGPEGRDWITGPVGGPIPFRVLVTSRRLPTRIRVYRTDLAKPREVAAFTLPPGVREGEWDGKADGAPAPPGTYQIVAFVRDQAGNVGRSAPVEPGPTRGQPGVSVRGLLAQPPGRPGAGRREGDVRRRLARAAVPLEGLPRRRAHGAGEGPAPDRGPVPGHRARRRVRRVRLQGRDRPPLHRGPVRRPVGRHRADPRRAARGAPGSAATRSTTTATAGPTRSTTAAPPRIRGCCRAGCRRASPTTSRRCSPSSTRRGSTTTSRPT